MEYFDPEDIHVREKNRNVILAHFLFNYLVIPATFHPSTLAFESFRQRSVRCLLKLFRLHVGSLPQLLSPGQWLKERGTYIRIAFFCIMAERTRLFDGQRSFRFLAERHKTSANGTLRKQLVCETTGHRWEGRGPLTIHVSGNLFK